jgi:hypothetical protein
LGTILKTVESSTNPGTLCKAEVRTRQGVVVALFGPGLYNLLDVEAVTPGKEVLLSMEPLPTILGLVEDE